MVPVIRLFLVVVVVLTAYAPTICAQDLSSNDRQLTLTALAAARGGDWGTAYAQMTQVKDPLPLKMLRWMDYTRATTAGRFAEIAEFIENNPDWPSQKRLRRRAEETLATEADDTAADWLKHHPATSAMGQTREGELKLSHGDIDGGTAELRKAWIDGDFNASDERGFWQKHGASMRTEDDIARLDRLLWDGQADAARRMLAMVPTDYRQLAEARLSLAAMAPNPDAVIAKVPPALRGDAGLVYEQLRWERKKDMYDAASQLLLAHPGDPVHAKNWWGERQVVARRILSNGNAELAERLVDQHGAIEGNELSEAEFLAGYIALRYRKNPAAAFEHFSRILARATNSYAKARAAYWGGRAAAAEGKPELATKWYAVGADHMATFYGQLAAHQLGRDAPPHPVPEPRPTADELARFDARELVRATKIFFAAGDRDNARLFLMRVSEMVGSPVEFAMLADVAERNGRVDLAIGVAKRAVDAGMPLTMHGYPVTAIPSGGTTEPPLLLAIVRQESAFALDAVSRAGALGLMQLMPATASFVANKLQLPFSAGRLTSDGEYNVMLGRSYLETLIDDFGGSYPLAIAAYNAGPGRVREWLHQYGDPRGRDIDMVDWLELIPFNETRTYVQRVLENLQIYRAQTGNEARAFSLVGDLAR